MPAQKTRILIVDDEQDICEVLRAKFQHYGFEVAISHDGKDAFERAESERVDCILLDIRMAGEDGLTFLRRLRHFRHDDHDIQVRVRKIPVIVLTAAGDNMRALFQVEGISDYVEKPFDTEDLKNRILNIVGKA